MASQACVPGVASGNLTCFNGGNACRVKPEPELFQLTIRSDIAEFSPFSCPISLGHPEARGRCSQGERALYGRDLCRSGGTVKAEPRSCRAQELARSSAQENERRKKAGLRTYQDRPHTSRSTVA